MASIQAADEHAHGSNSGAAQIYPIGDRGLLVRFGDQLTDEANRLAISASQMLSDANLQGVEEIAPNLVSVLLRYDPTRTSFSSLSANVSLSLGVGVNAQKHEPHQVDIEVIYGGETGPDLEEASAQCKLSVEEFIDAHNSSRLRVLATGFAPGFVYCGLHQENLHIPRRVKIHTSVGAGSVIFAAGQTAITATSVPTGWHVIGRTDYANFNPLVDPPTKLRAGDLIRFSSRTAK